MKKLIFALIAIILIGMLVLGACEAPSPAPPPALEPKPLPLVP